MRIGIDARFFGPRVGGGGLGRYVSELVNHLQMLDERNEYVIFLKKENFADFKVTKPNITKRLVDVAWYSFAEQTVLPREILAAKVDMMHFPHWNVPVFCQVPFIVTIHDLILLDDPSSARATTRGPIVHGAKYLGFRLVLEAAVRRSRHIIAVSEATKRSILKHFSVAPSKITVIHNGVRAPEDGKGVSLRELGVLEPYILYVGNSYPHKNLFMLLEAFSIVHAQLPRMQLVFAGKHDQFSRALEQEARDRGFGSEHFRFINLPTDNELGALYRHASVLAYPSKIEGFGIPPLEAMWCGTPVVCSNTTSLPEIVGDAAQTVSPDDPQRFSQALLAAIARKPEVVRMIDHGKKRVHQFLWEDAAGKTLEAYLSHGIRRL
ncbi:glycosyltransferase family 4 protein [Patescibacteria group bacterium]|nr:glycosyltransferase family 4 protein [Patescibacteria group bacterium]